MCVHVTERISYMYKLEPASICWNNSQRFFIIIWSHRICNTMKTFAKETFYLSSSLSVFSANGNFKASNCLEITWICDCLQSIFFFSHSYLKLSPGGQKVEVKYPLYSRNRGGVPIRMHVTYRGFHIKGPTSRKQGV